MTSRMKLRLLLSSVTLILLLCAFHIDSWRQNVAYELQVLNSQRQAEELAAIEGGKEQRLIREGTVWLGDLDLPATSQQDSLRQKPRISASPQLYQRIWGWIPSRNSSVTAQYDMHECNPGSPTCTTGGTISIESSNRAICTISLNLLQPDASGHLRSTFRVNWWDTSLSQGEKFEIFQELAGPAVVADAATLGQLLRSTYRDGSAAPALDKASRVASHEGLLRFILLGILKAVVTRPA
jgi:hypothetical protein